MDPGSWGRMLALEIPMWRLPISLGAVFILEVATGHNASEGVGDAVLGLPVEHLGVERGFFHIRTRKSTKTRTLGWVTVSPD